MPRASEDTHGVCWTFDYFYTSGSVKRHSAVFLSGRVQATFLLWEIENGLHFFCWFVQRRLASVLLLSLLSPLRFSLHHELLWNSSIPICQWFLLCASCSVPFFLCTATKKKRSAFVVRRKPMNEMDAVSSLVFLLDCKIVGLLIFKRFHKWCFLISVRMYFF